MVIGVGVWLITGRSPMAIIVKSALHQMDTESYDNAMADKTDKSTTKIPADVVFPREVVQYTIGNMQVFKVPAENDTKPVVIYLHGGAYVHNFTSQHWSAMAEWAKTTGCGIVAHELIDSHTYTDIISSGCTNVIEVAKFRNKGSLVGSFAKLWFELESNRLKNELAENVIYNWNPPHIQTDLPFDEPNEDEVCPF